MAIIKQEFETLVNRHGTELCDMRDLLEQSREISRTWNNHIVRNSDGVNFRLDKDLKFRYETELGEKKEADISQYAFSQLCARMGVPASYIGKCFKSGKEDLALQNFRAWADGMDKDMLIRENDGVVRAVLSDSYAPFDSYKVLRTLKHTVDTGRWQPTQAFLSEDKMVVRFVDFNKIPVDDGSPLYLGFNVSSSDVGRGSLNIKLMIYRSVCTNGLLISSMNGTLYKHPHVGARMTEGKMQEFQKAFRNIDVIAKEVIKNIELCRNRRLKDFEIQMYLEKAKREMKLSEKSSDELVGLLGIYEPTKWGIINSVTELAQNFSLEKRLEMETWAGDLFGSKAA